MNNFKKIFSKKALLVTLTLAISAISCGVIFFPWTGTYYGTVPGNSRTSYSGTYTSYIGYTTKYSQGCATTSWRNLVIGISLLSGSGSTSSKTTLVASDKDITLTTSNFKDTTCTTPNDILVAKAYTPSEDTVVYNYTIKNEEQKKIRTTSWLAPTLSAAATLSEKLTTQTYPVEEGVATIKSHTITCASTACAAQLQAIYQGKVDQSVAPQTKIAACGNLSFSAGTAVDVSACEKAELEANKKLGKGINSYTDPIPMEMYYDGTNKRLYVNFIEYGAIMADYIQGDSYYQQ